MTALALALVLTAAVLHAVWNLALKRSGASGLAFFWLVGIVESLACLPFAVQQCVAGGSVPPLGAFGAMLGSAVVHVAYFLFLARGYRSGALSIVYPLARATGPLLTIVWAIAWLGERPPALALGGALAIALGAVLLSADPRTLGRAASRQALGFALATGAMIATYTAWDRQAVNGLGLAPVVYYGGSLLLRVAITTPLVLRQRALAASLWRTQRRAVLVVGILSPASYLLVLTAMQLAPLSSVAPAREVSILIAAVLGTRWLGEGQTVRRLGAAVVMVAGLVAIAVAGR